MNLSYQKKTGSNHSTNSGSDVDSQRRRRQVPRHLRPSRNINSASDTSFVSSDADRSQIRFSTPKKQNASPRQEEEIQRRDFVHPYAHQPTPYEKLVDIYTNLQESSMFIIYEVLVWILDKLWGLFLNLVLSPVAILGLLLDFMRK